MKVIHVIGGGAYGGAEQHILQLLTLLKKRGVQPKVVCFYDAAFANQLRARNIEVYVLKHTRFDVRLLRELKAYFELENPAIIHTHGVKANFFARIAARHLRHIPKVTTIHSMLRHDYEPFAYKFVRLMEGLTRPFNDYYIAVSNAILQSLVRDHVNPEQIAVVYHGMDTNKFRPQIEGEANDRANLRAEWDIPTGAYVIGMVGRLVPIKGLAEALQAFKLISWEVPHAHFVLVGEGPQLHELQQLANRYGIGDRTHFVGFRSDVESCLRAFDCFVSASYSEGLGLNIIEAMATALPVVVTGVGGVLDFVKHEQNGLIVPANDPHTMAESLIRLIRDPEQGYLLGASARGFVSRRFSLTLMADNTLHVYNRLIKIRRNILRTMADRGPLRLVISGYYGYGNSGDEALLESILLALREESKKAGIKILPIVHSIRPQATEIMHGVKAVHRLNVFAMLRELRQSDGLISGGGSLLQDATSVKTIPYYLTVIKLAQLLKKPTFVYAQGVGPISHRTFYPFIRHVYGRATYLSVRDEASRTLLADIGLDATKIDIASDPVMGLPLTPAEERSTHARRPIQTEQKASELPIIGVAVREWLAKHEDLDAIADALARLLRSRSVRVRLLPFHIPHDMKAMRHVYTRVEQQCSLAEMANIELVLDAVQPQDMLREIRACALLIGMRLHSLVYAAANHIPMLGISYDPKIDHFLDQLDLPVAAHCDTIDAAQLAEQALEMLERGHTIMQERKTQIHHMQQTSNVPAQQIVSFMQTQTDSQAIDLYGVQVSRRAMGETVAYLADRIAARQVTQVVTVNPIMMMEGLANEAFMQVLVDAELVVPDGTGVVWAAKHQGTPVKERVAGYDLLHELMQVGNDKRWKVYLVGSSLDVVEAAAVNLEARYPGIDIVGAQDGFFTEEDDQLVVSDIRSKQPDILLVARSMALQEPWIAKYKTQLNVPVMMGVGGSFDVIAGRTKRAPDIYIKFRVEWLYRLLKEPWRAKRMIALPKFAWRVLRTSTRKERD
jgi:polysaccharide pyruvyl transferase CsaB